MKFNKILNNFYTFFRLLYISFFTFRRDFTGMLVYVEANIKLWFANKTNQTVYQMFDKVANKYPEKVCFYFQEQQWTFKQIQDMSNQIGNYFGSLGYIKGDSIALFMENKPEYVIIWLGLSRIGVVIALINTNLRSEALKHCIQAASCRAIIYGQELDEAVKEIRKEKKYRTLPTFCLPSTELNGNKNIVSEALDLRKCLKDVSKTAPIPSERVNFRDGMLYIYTSGTTGLPKAAIIKNSRFLMMALVIEVSHRIKYSDRIYTVLPLYHWAGLVMSVGVAFRSGSSVIFRTKFSASQFWSDCIKYDVTVVQYIGEICRFLLAQPPKPEDSLHGVRLAYGNGLRPEIWTDFKTRFNIENIFEVYGSTEGNCNLGNFDNTVGAVGFIPPLLKNVMPWFLVKIDKDGEIMRDPNTGLAIKCKANEPGEMVGIIKEGINGFEGYTDEKAKKKKIVNDLRKNGDSAFRSGDILRIDEYGYVYFMDRQGDTFRWKGENVSTAEVEIVMSRCLGLKDAAVYGVHIPGADGRAGMASVVDPENQVDLTKLAKDLKKELPSYARPVFIRILKEMPMTGSFKLQKSKLQADGFDLTKISDKIYIFHPKLETYQALTNEIYTGIISSNFKI